MLKAQRTNSSKITAKSKREERDRDRAMIQAKNSLLQTSFLADGDISKNSKNASRAKGKQLKKKEESLTQRIQGYIRVQSTGMLSMPIRIACMKELRGKGSKQVSKGEPNLKLQMLKDREASSKKRKCSLSSTSSKRGELDEAHSLHQRNGEQLELMMQMPEYY